MPQAQLEISKTRVERIRVRRAFLFVAKGHSERRRSVVVQARKRFEPESSPEPCLTNNIIGVGFTATKKIGSAVIRNRAKRRMREAAKMLLPSHGLPNVDYVFIARRDTATRPWQGLLDDIESALLSLREHILSGEPPAPQTPRVNRPRSKRRSGENKK